jgi:molecular chaperone IbpA
MDIPSVQKFGIGFDSIFEELARMGSQQSLNYPPYNISRNTENSFTIEVAVAGFEQGEITVGLDNRVLTISGTKGDEPTPEYLYKGISTRDFVREFTLAEHVEVVNASQQNGILSIYLEREVPEEKKPRSIAINYKK